MVQNDRPHGRPVIGRSDDLRSVWRSWFWNAVLTVGLMFLAVVVTGVALITEPAASVVVCAVLAMVLWAGTVRAPFLAVFARPRGIVIRGLARTVTIPWEEIEEVTGAGVTTGTVVAPGATTPVVVRRGRGGRKSKRIELNVLGGWGVSRSRPTPAERAIADLNAHLAQWRQAQAPPAQTPPTD